MLYCRSLSMPRRPRPTAPGSPRQLARTVARAVPVLALAGLALVGCKKERRYTANVELVQVQRFGRDPNAPAALMDLEMRYVDCPGDARTLVRAEKSFSLCAKNLQAGDKLKVEIVSRYRESRDSYRAEITKIGDCPVQVDPKDEANYETVQTCTERKASGATVGVHCTRKRSAELLAKCPWLGR
jgi:hypothetical protein